MNPILQLIAAVLATAILPACATRDVRPPIVVQGAMDIEIRKLASMIDAAAEEHVSGWTFWRGTIDGYPIVISKTLKGMENAAAATAIDNYRHQYNITGPDALGAAPDRSLRPDQARAYDHANTLAHHLDRHHQHNLEPDLGLSP